MIYYVSDIVEEYLKLGKFERPFEPIPNTMNWLPDDEDMIPKGQQSLNGFEKRE